MHSRDSTSYRQFAISPLSCRSESTLFASIHQFVAPRRKAAYAHTSIDSIRHVFSFIRPLPFCPPAHVATLHGADPFDVVGFIGLASRGGDLPNRTFWPLPSYAGMQEALHASQVVELMKGEPVFSKDEGVCIRGVDCCGAALRNRGEEGCASLDLVSLSSGSERPETLKLYGRQEDDTSKLDVSWFSSDSWLRFK